MGTTWCGCEAQATIKISVHTIGPHVCADIYNLSGEDAFAELREFLRTTRLRTLHLHDINEDDLAAVTGLFPLGVSSLVISGLTTSAGAFLKFIVNTPWAGTHTLSVHPITVDRLVYRFSVEESHEIHRAARIRGIRYFDARMLDYNVTIEWLNRDSYIHIVFAVLCGTLPGSLPITRFLRRDGDNAILSRVVRFLL